MRNKILSTSLILLFFLGSCKKDQYNVPDSIQPYIDDFLAEAASRGVVLKIDDLIVVFESNLEVDGVEAAGLCTRGNSTPEIKIDTNSVNWQVNLSSREQLIFHELGHCVLERNHIATKMSNNNFKTLMRPTGDQIYGPLYSRFKRTYYLDEMFNIGTTFPQWAENVLPYNDVSFFKELVFEEAFNDNDGGWSTGISDSTSRKIEGGVYKLNVLKQGGYFVGNNLDIEPGRDFEIEAKIKLIDGGFTGLLWGGEELSNSIPSFKSIYFGRGVISIGSIVDGTESTHESVQLSEGFNTISIRKIGNDLIYYINSKIIDNMQINQLIGDKIGFPFGGANSVEVHIDHLRLYYLN